MANWKLSPGDWCHIEFLSSDAERSKRFYGDVFGWQYEDIPGADYVNVKTSEDGIEGGIGGLAQATGQAPAAPNGLFAYLLAPDMDATLVAIERGGHDRDPQDGRHGHGRIRSFPGSGREFDRTVARCPIGGAPAITSS